jgi:ribosomal protein L11 methyltransferase
VQRWREIAIEVPEDASDAVANWLVERGAPGLIEESLDDDHVRLRAHFADVTDVAALVVDTRGFLADIDGDFPGAASSAVGVATLDAEDWAEGWKQGFSPLEIGRSLCVRPPWCPARAARLDIVIEPAMAFGTGHHASTLGCLLAIEEVFHTNEAIASTLDVGTGSGILAIAAARLGAGRIVAVDNDSIAVEAAAANVARNGLDDAIELRVGELGTFSEPFRLIVANLYSGLLAHLFERFAACADRDAWLVTSGLLDADRGAVVRAAAAAGWRKLAARSIDGWTTLTFRRGEVAGARTAHCACARRP